MDYMSALPSTKRGNDCVFVVVDRFSKMEILAACKKNITVKATTKLFFERVWVHFGIPQTIVSDRDSRFLSTFSSSLWSLLDTKLTKSTAFHPQTDGQTEVVNWMIVHMEMFFLMRVRGHSSKGISSKGHSSRGHSSRGIVPQVIVPQVIVPKGIVPEGVVPEG
jgi:hypothetical protein